MFLTPPPENNFNKPFFENLEYCFDVNYQPDFKVVEMLMQGRKIKVWEGVVPFLGETFARFKLPPGIMLYDRLEGGKVVVYRDKEFKI